MMVEVVQTLTGVHIQIYTAFIQDFLITMLSRLTISNAITTLPRHCQIFFFTSGESGSGKTEAFKHIVRHLTARSSPKGFGLEPKMKHVSQRTFDSYGIIFSLGLDEFLSDIFIRMQKGSDYWILIFVVVLLDQGLTGCSSLSVIRSSLTVFAYGTGQK